MGPILGGLFCERAFGSFQRGICSCKRTQWRIYPKFPKKLRRIEILYCYECSTQTIFKNLNKKMPIIFFHQWKIFSLFEKFDIKKKNIFPKNAKKAYVNGINLLNFSKIFNLGRKESIIPNKLTCKCGKINLFIKWFFSVFRTCRFCISSTRYPFYGKITTHWISNPQFYYDIRYKKEK